MDRKRGVSVVLNPPQVQQGYKNIVVGVYIIYKRRQILHRHQHLITLCLPSLDVMPIRYMPIYQYFHYNVRMSSIISDIFFNSHNHALFDQYLQQQPSLTHDPNPTPDPLPHLLTLHFHLHAQHLPVALQPGHLYTIAIKIGIHVTQQLVQITQSNILSAELKLEIKAEELSTHTAVGVEVLGSGRLQLGQGYIAIENLREAMAGRAGEVGVSMRGKAGKWRVGCNIGARHDRDHSEQQEVRNRSRDSSRQKSRDKGRRSKKGREESLVNSRSHSPSHSRSHSRTVPSPSPLPLPCTPVSLTPSSFTPVSPHCPQPTLVSLPSLTMHPFPQPLSIPPGEITSSGLTIRLWAGQSEEIGYVHLSPVVVLGGVVEGVFPVLGAMGNCVGVLQVGAEGKQQKMEQRRQREKHGESVYGSSRKSQRRQSKAQQIKQPDQTIVSGIALSIPKLYILNPPAKHSTTTLTLHYGCSLRSYAKFTLAPAPSGLQVHITEPLICYQLSQNIPEYAQLQVYVGHTLIGYYRFQLMIQPMQPDPALQYSGQLANMSTNGYITHAAINHLQFRLPPGHFPPQRLLHSLSCLAPEHMQARLATIKQPTRQALIESIMAEDRGMVLAQVHRIVDLYLGAGHGHTMVGVEVRQAGHTGRLREEVEYLDGDGRGEVDEGDFGPVARYYGVESGLWEGAAVGKAGNRRVLYLFVLNSVHCHIKHMPTLPSLSLPTPQSQQQPSITTGQPAPQPLSPRVPVPQSPGVVLCQARCHNLHLLLHPPRIPSALLHIPSLNYTSRIHYSNANPVIHVNRCVPEGERVVLMHEDVRRGERVGLAEFRLRAGLAVYALGQGVHVQVQMEGQGQESLP